MLTTQSLFDLSHTLAAPLLRSHPFPWEVLDEIGDFLRSLGAALNPADFDQPSPDVWIAKTASVAPSAVLIGPCIIGPETQIRPSAFLRGAVLLGKGVVVGNSTELKNCILMDRAQAPHFNYIGDSILGFRAHLGAGAVTSNVKGDQTPVVIQGPCGPVPTGRKKLGAMIGDGCEIGCHAVLNPGAVLGPHAQIYPLSSVRGYVPGNCIFKRPGEIVERRKPKETSL